MSEIVAYQQASLSERMQYAQTLSAGGDLIPRGLYDNRTGQPSPGKILLVMETGAMLGLNPMAALQGIDVIEGKPTISPQLMTAVVRAAGHRVDIESRGSIPEGTYSVTVTLTRSDGGRFSSAWDMSRAVRAGLCEYRKNGTGDWEVRAVSKSGKPLPWQAYPETMCKWRAVGDVCREGADDVLKGIAYTREEIESGVSIAAEPTPEQTEDWVALIDEAASVEALEAVAARLKEAGEGTAELRTRHAARLGILKREAETVDAEIVDEPGEVVADGDA